VAAAGTVAAIHRAAPRGFWTYAWSEMQRPVEPPPHQPYVRAWPDRGLHVAWLGHSTTLINVDGFTILTDPVLTNYAGFHIGPLSLGLKRLTAPAIRVQDLPRIDLILLSHAHMDHFDTRTLRALENKGTRVVTAWQTSDLLRVRRYHSVQELRWNQQIWVGEVTVRAIQVKHWGARYRTDTYRGYNGYVIEAGAHRVLFAGDTAETDTFRSLRTRRGFDVAIMPIGAYNPWIRNHCTPEQAWRMGNDAGAELFVPVHHQTFRLSREPRLEPIERFLSAAASRPERVATHSIGQEIHL
jgi:L-ascorbate metabolism protein UlaG (beta-lactamase superfamily)